MGCNLDAPRACCEPEAHLRHTSFVRAFCSRACAWMGVPVSESAASLPSPPDSRTSHSPADSSRTGTDVGAVEHVTAPAMSAALSLDHLSDLDSSPEPPAIAPRSVAPPVPSRGGTLDQAISLDSDESSDDEVSETHSHRGGSIL